MNIFNDYIPIPLETIQPHSCIGCNIYIKIHANFQTRYILYCSAENIFKQDKIEELLKHNIQWLFISKEDQKKYFQYAESRLKHIIAINTIDVKTKSQLLYGVAKSIMFDIFQDPRSGDNVDRSKNWVSSTVEFVIKNKEATSTMLSMVSHDYYTYTHSVDVSVLGLLFSKYLGFNGNKMHAFGTGLLLHDIGKTQIGLDVLNKKGKLSEHEFSTIKRHVEFGEKIMEELGGLEKESYYPILQHHEKCNGSGYPKGLKGEEIHDYGKIATIIDVYDALTTERPYSKAKKPFYALKIMKEEMATHLDKSYFESFVLFLGTKR